MSTLTRIKLHFSETFATLLSPFTLLSWAVCIVVAVLAGPFGTYAGMNLQTRLVYWLVIVTIAIVIGHAARAAAVALIGPRRPILFDLVAATLVVIFLSPVIRIVRGVTEPSLDGLSLISIGLNTFVIAAGVFVLRRQSGLEQPGSYWVKPTEPEAPVPRLCRRLSDEFQGEILRLSASDHFVEVTTVNGVETLRMRLADAIDEMDPTHGYCVHRSHWVAHSAVVGIERENSHKLFVKLSNGDELPVSRKYRPNLVNAGLID